MNNPETKEDTERRIKILEKKVLSNLKSESKEDIRRVCNRIASHISDVLSREKQIDKLQTELKKLKSKGD
jgi:phage shock protein A